MFFHTLVLVKATLTLFQTILVYARLVIKGQASWPHQRSGKPQDAVLIKVYWQILTDGYQNLACPILRHCVYYPLLLQQMCALVEMDGLSTWVYSDGAVGTVRNPGLLHRDSYPGASRKVVLAELEYHDDQYQIKFDDGDVGVLCRYVRQ